MGFQAYIVTWEWPPERAFFFPTGERPEKLLWSREREFYPTPFTTYFCPLRLPWSTSVWELLWVHHFFPCGLRWLLGFPPREDEPWTAFLQNVQQKGGLRVFTWAVSWEKPLPERLRSPDLPVWDLMCPYHFPAMLKTLLHRKPKVWDCFSSYYSLGGKIWHELIWYFV